ncbi:MAG TPA: hypothetical protein DHN29_09920 [Cytophagales bacterium]|nr:hypothetical protein [Cytophagales bacterium]
MKSILIVGTGTIGEPLIGLLAVLKNKLGIDEVMFYKRTPLIDEVAKVNSLCQKGAKLVVTDSETANKFEALGHEVSMNFLEALLIADVVIDCTPAGNQNKEMFYTQRLYRTKKKALFIAQGSEKGFGVPYAYGINDCTFDDNGDSSFIQVVSCNTHNIACLIKSIVGENKMARGDFTCIRRANDVSQKGNFIASPSVGNHDVMKFGTHHAQDVHDLFETMGEEVHIFSSAMKTNSQYMHVIRFSIGIRGDVTHDDVLDKLNANKFIALTHKTCANQIFSFGRDHGYYGRIYNQGVLSIPTLHVTKGQSKAKTHVTGFCFTPQDGNSLLSSVAATLYGLHGKGYREYTHILDGLLFQNI